MSYSINEIFYSLQGEGLYTGTPSVFVRFAGCNRRCAFCDTDFADHTPMTAEEILAAVATHPGAHHVILTGGEPALQVDDVLVDALHRAGCFIHIETNGSLPLHPAIDWVTCSPKDGPLNIDRIDELKVVYPYYEDPEAILARLSDRLKPSPIDGRPLLLLQPCHVAGDPAATAANLRATIAYLLAHPHWRLSLQTHKLLSIP